MACVPFRILNNGEKMPALGLGTYLYRGGEAITMIKKSIEIGYRHFDTAYLYSNELEVGEGIRAKIADGSVRRSEVFVAAKMWTIYNAPDKVEAGCRNSLNNFGLDYIDLFLMHLPTSIHFESDEQLWSKNEDGSLHVTNVDYVDTWRAMEELVDIGLVKSIGVSNFNRLQIQRLVTFARIQPVVNQIECCPTLNQQEMIEFCRGLDIVIIAYCPLRHPEPVKRIPPFLTDDRVRRIGEKYGKTNAQICLRYLIELGTVPIPKSICEEHMRSNIDVFDFQLTDDEMQLMHSFNTSERLMQLLQFRNSEYYPFLNELQQIDKSN